MIGRRRYLFTINRESKRGIMASVLGVTALIAFIAAFTMTVRNNGTVSARFGTVGFVSFIFSIAGFILGIASLTEEDRFPLFPRLGFGSSLLALILWGGILYAGIAGL